MPYYHVYIVHHDPRNSQKEAYELDLTKEELMTQIVTPYLTGQSFMCGGQPVDSFSVGDIVISESEKSSVELLPKLKAEEERRSNETGIGGGLSDEYLVIRNGRNVTRTYVPHPPRKEGGSGKKEELKRARSKNVFIVHGRDHAPMRELKKMLFEFRLNPIVLHEEASGGLTLAEKLEKYSKDVGYAFVTLTPEDVGGHRNEMRQKLGGDTPILSRPITVFGGNIVDKVLDLFEPRARQNVIFEMGYFWGLLERKRVCCLLKGNVEKPSDIEGIVYIPFKDSVNDVKEMIVKELTVAGYDVSSRKEEDNDMKKLRADVETEPKQA